MNIDPKMQHGESLQRPKPSFQCILLDNPVTWMRSTACEIHHLRIIEDAAHALPSGYRGKHVGRVSEFTCFSFYATKTFTTGEGGMITTDNPEAADRMRLMRLHGIERDAWKRYRGDGSWFYEVLKRDSSTTLPIFNRPLALFNWPNAMPCGKLVKILLGDIRMPFPFARNSSSHSRADRTTSWHLYILRLHLDRLTMDRNGFIEALRGRGVACSVHFIPLHLQPYYQRAYGYQPGETPNAEREYHYVCRCRSSQG